MYYALLALFAYGHARQKWDTWYRITGHHGVWGLLWKKYLY